MNAKTWKHVIVPGRHHAMTRFQAQWIEGCKKGQWTDSQGETVLTDDDTIWIFPVTSANHHTTRRNPIPLERRVAQVELFAYAEKLRALIVPIPDVSESSRFASHVLSAIHAATGIAPTPKDTLVAVSTPVGDLYRELGFHIGGIENDGPEGTATAWDAALAGAGGDTHAFRNLAHPASVDVWGRYELGELVASVFADAVVSGEDGGLTITRSYATYAASFETSAARKWEQIKGWVRPGRIVDVGCASGQLLAEAGKDFPTSDMIGVETDRWLHAEAVHRAEQGAFPNPNTSFYRRNILAGEVFTPGSVDTTITIALTHEVFSYGQRDKDLTALMDTILKHTRVGGVWINLDVAGPKDPGRIVHLRVPTNDGENLGSPDLDSLTGPQVKEHLEKASTFARLLAFADGYPKLSGQEFKLNILEPGLVSITLGSAMEFLLHKDYPDNWQSELHETFTYRNWEQWEKDLDAKGWQALPGSGGFLNEWIAKNRLDPVAELLDPATGERIPWPDTHVLFAATPKT